MICREKDLEFGYEIKPFRMHETSCYLVASSQPLYQGFRQALPAFAFGSGYQPRTFEACYIVRDPFASLNHQGLNGRLLAVSPEHAGKRGGKNGFAVVASAMENRKALFASIASQAVANQFLKIGNQARTSGHYAG